MASLEYVIGFLKRGFCNLASWGGGGVWGRFGEGLGKGWRGVGEGLERVGEGLGRGWGGGWGRVGEGLGRGLGKGWGGFGFLYFKNPISSEKTY